jgi:hypothetical protein
MPRLNPVLVALALATSAALPAWAASSASSASSDGSSASVGSSSTSIEKSSNSSSKGDKVADGDYRVIQVAEAAQQPGKLRLTLRATNDSGEEFVLVLPQEAAAQGKLATGAVVTAKAQAYGLQFASAETREAFFLVLRDDWHRELATKPVTL